MGTEHRVLAEQHLFYANHTLQNAVEEADDQKIWFHLRSAQVYATLALAEASNPVDLIRLVRKEFAQKIATALREHCSHCSAVALGLGEQP